ncbi:hypothetical protein BDV27DRAFT_155388 [Aspergillus caelatus]|uniref:Homeodomain-like protein n=1 Tax=Aspergillus caelatus TaxID=61420 RepID=A0A5N7AAT6_9EURO|nr:uncharacterized protein BDV27DRAFT_155388 [Aspergillus caelatus]KAE8367007.1 hypothetical protein BDV27DRAFT_155388 [Aspergillus caelatus]
MPRVRRKWTPEEDSLLRYAVTTAMEQSRPLMWRELAKSVPGRSNKDCRRRWWNSLADGTAKGLWSEDEDERLMRAVNKYGTDWRRVAQEVISRTPDQCSSHWSQDEQLLHEVLTHGTNWTVIATSHVPRRTTLSLKNRYATLRLRHENNNRSEEKSVPKFDQTPSMGLGEGCDQEGDSTEDKQRGNEDNQDDGDDSGHEDDSGDEDNEVDGKDIFYSEGSTSTSNLSMLPPTPNGWVNVFEQGGELPTISFNNHPSPLVPGLGSDTAPNNNVSHENTFMLGSISDEMTTNPLCVSYGREPMDTIPALSQGYPNTSRPEMGTAVPLQNPALGSLSISYQVSVTMVCTDSQLESVITALAGTGSCVNVQIKPKPLDE